MRRSLYDARNKTTRHAVKNVLGLLTKQTVLDLKGGGEFRVLSGSGRGSQVRLIGRFAPAIPRFYRFPAGMDSSPSAQVQLLP